MFFCKIHDENAKKHTFLLKKDVFDNFLQIFIYFCMSITAYDDIFAPVQIGCTFTL